MVATLFEEHTVGMPQLKYATYKEMSVTLDSGNMLCMVRFKFAAQYGGNPVLVFVL
jgi:hypothetical protein